MKWMHRNIVALIVAVALSVGLAGPAAAQLQIQDGLVNVAIGDVTIQDINIGVAAQIIANVCSIRIQAAVLAVLDVDQGGDDFTCTARGGEGVTVTQN
jgi:TolA-binding protein